MKVKYTFIPVILWAIVAAFTTKPNKKFKIFGKAVGFTDSTLIYLDDVSDGTYRHLDSALIINQKFYFEFILAGILLSMSLTFALI